VIHAPAPPHTAHHSQSLRFLLLQAPAPSSLRPLPPPPPASRYAAAPPLRPGVPAVRCLPLTSSIPTQVRGFAVMGRHAADEGGQLQLMEADSIEEEESFESIDKCTSRRLFSPPLPLVSSLPLLVRARALCHPTNLFDVPISDQGGQARGVPPFLVACISVGVALLRSNVDAIRSFELGLFCCVRLWFELFRFFQEISSVGLVRVVLCCVVLFYGPKLWSFSLPHV
jgi:hypothetical protein